MRLILWEICIVCYLNNLNLVLHFLLSKLETKIFFCHNWHRHEHFFVSILNYIKWANIKSEILYKIIWIWSIFFQYSIMIWCCIWKHLAWHYVSAFVLTLRRVLLWWYRHLFFKMHPLWKQNNFMHDFFYVHNRDFENNKMKISLLFLYDLATKDSTTLPMGLNMEYVMLWCYLVMLMPKEFYISYKYFWIFALIFW